MSKYMVDSSDLTSVADAIRTKGETSASLEFPNGFVNAIGDISGGISDNAKVLLLTILKAGVYTSDQSDNIAALEAALIPVTFEKRGTTLVGTGVPTITTITKQGKTLVCA